MKHHHRFIPAFALTGPHTQTVLLGVRGVRPWRAARSAKAWLPRTTREVLNCGEGVRLEAFRTPPEKTTGSSSTVLLHGWLGSADSPQILALASTLLKEGHEIWRLNLRDHGDSHALNPEIFHSCRIEEVTGAVEAIAKRTGDHPLNLIGLSLGGNFFLRVAARAPKREIPLRKVVAINAPIDPAKVMDKLEERPRIYHRYFLERWREALKNKQSAFPDLYDFREDLEVSELRELTRLLIERHTDEFPSLAAYFDGYSIVDDRLATIEAPTVLVTSTDDPIIPFRDYENLRLPDCARIEPHPHGGHCGYVKNWRFESWLEDRAAALLRGQV